MVSYVNLTQSFEYFDMREREKGKQFAMSPLLAKKIIIYLILSKKYFTDIGHSHFLKIWTNYS